MSTLLEHAFRFYSLEDWLLLIAPLITISTIHGSLYIIICRVFGENEPYMVEYQMAQSGTSRAPYFAWGLLKKSLDQSNRQELHAAISCLAFCSTAWLYPLFCTNHANSTSWIRLSAALPVANVPSWIAHTHGGAHTFAHAYGCTFAHTHNYYDHFLAPWPDCQCPTKTHSFLDQAAESHCHILTFSPTQLIKHSLCCIGKAISINGVITDSKLGAFSPADR